LPGKTLTIDYQPKARGWASAARGGEVFVNAVSIGGAEAKAVGKVLAAMVEILYKVDSFIPTSGPAGQQEAGPAT